MRFDRAAIAARIPHQGAMCLLDGVVECDDERIVCRALSHRAADNPLRSAGCLHAACGIEYAAQAMALHGALGNAGAARPRAGFLASVRGVEFAVERLDDIAHALDIVAQRLGGDGNHVLYEFRISAAGAELLRGRAAVVLDAEAAA